MKKKISLLLLLLTLVVACAGLCGCGTSSSNPYDYYPPDNGYSMANVRITVDASAGDRSMLITEEYTFDFYESSHGFYRDIPVNSGERIRDVKVTDISNFGNVYKVLHEGSDIVRIRVGSASSYINGSNKRATISYKMITPPHADYPDALVLNVIGQGWSCNILSADIKVILPAETNQTPRYYYGEWGSTSDAVADGMVSVNPESGKKEYTFSVIEPLSAYNGLTVYYFMPEGTFKSYKDNYIWALIIAGVVILAVSLLLKFTLGSNMALTPVINYYPPKHPDAGEKDLPIDPVDMGFLIDNSCEGSDVTSLIFYFASKGYLNIIEPESDDNKSKSFKLVKVCDLPEGLPEYQYTFFNRIFSGKRKSVTVSELTNKTYTAVSSVQTQIKSKYRGKLYSRKAKAASICMSLLSVLFAFLSVFLLCKRMISSYNYVAGIVAVFPAVITYLGMSYVVFNWHKMGKAKRITLITVFCIVAAILSAILVLVTYRDLVTLPEITVITATVALNSAIAPFIARRTEFYNQELNEILGFKEFLQTAEKDRLETLLEENPQYYYDILPYANVLGVSDIWQNKFEGLTLEPPTYYRGGVFVFATFNSHYRHSYRAYSAAAVSRPSSSSGSGGGHSFGGGGHSGGGFGGGGGGRW